MLSSQVVVGEGSARVRSFDRSIEITEGSTESNRRALQSRQLTIKPGTL